MRVVTGIRRTATLLGWILLLPCSTTLAQDGNTPPFDPHDLSGVWGAVPGQRAPFNYGMKTPPPHLTKWGMEHLRMKAITHAAIGPDPDMTINGVPANTLGGEYPGKNCEPLSMPANLDYVRFGPFEFVYTPAGDRIVQMLEYHREWRTFWMNTDHPKDVFPSYMGHSVAHWEGDTLVVDTIGFNGKNQITQGVGHRASDAFHLVERYTRTSHDRLELEMTMYDRKAWGDASWTGLHKTFALMPGEKLQEFICVPSELETFDETLEQGKE